MREGRGEGSDLPAEYVDPWRLLGRDLRAVLASLRLRLWELGRRNRGGELWRPPFWPASLAPLFWPLALALLLIALVAGVGAIRGVSPAGEDPARETPAVVEAPAPPSEALPPGGRREDSPADPALESPAVASPVELPPLPTPPLPPPAAEPAPAAEPPPPPDPLLSALGETGATSLLQAARAEPARSLLVLTATPAFSALPPAERQGRAEGWWRQGQELGYERLELRDGRGRLLARSALVGEGLVLFEPVTATTDADPA
jgi:hypothetical protein